jgi:hypothetical protein
MQCVIDRVMRYVVAVLLLPLTGEARPWQRLGGDVGRILGGLAELSVQVGKLRYRIDWPVTLRSRPPLVRLRQVKVVGKKSQWRLDALTSSRHGRGDESPHLSDTALRDGGSDDGANALIKKGRRQQNPHSHAKRLEKTYRSAGNLAQHLDGLVVTQLGEKRGTRGAEKGDGRDGLGGGFEGFAKIVRFEAAAVG